MNVAPSLAKLIDNSFPVEDVDIPEIGDIVPSDRFTLSSKQYLSMIHETGPKVSLDIAQSESGEITQGGVYYAAMNLIQPDVTNLYKLMKAINPDLIVLQTRPEYFSETFSLDRLEDQDLDSLLIEPSSMFFNSGECKTTMRKLRKMMP